MMAQKVTSEQESLLKKLASGGCPLLTMDTATKIAQEASLGWYVAPRGKSFTVGKFLIYAPHQRLQLVNEDQSPMTFSSADEARKFLKEKLGVFNAEQFSAC